MRRRIVRLSVALAAVTIAVFGVPLALGVAQYLLADQYGQLERLAGAAAIAASGDLAAPQVRPPLGSGVTCRSGCTTNGATRSAATGPTGRFRCWLTR